MEQISPSSFSTGLFFLPFPRTVRPRIKLSLDYDKRPSLVQLAISTAPDPWFFHCRFKVVNIKLPPPLPVADRGFGRLTQCSMRTKEEQLS
jgi:hypothetical protein